MVCVSANRGRTVSYPLARQTNDGARAAEAARRIATLGPLAVIVKGGHADTTEIVDLLYDGISVRRFPHERVASTSTHGTGCTFAAALVAHLAHGRSLVEALPLTQQCVAGAIRNAPGLGAGHGPMDHFWNQHRADDISLA